MKKAKRRIPPFLARLISSTRRVNRAISSAVAYVAKPNRRLAKHKPGSLADRLEPMSDMCIESVEKLRGMVQKSARPVSIAAMNDAIVAKVTADADTLRAVEAMKRFIRQQQRKRAGRGLSLRRLIDEGRD